MQFKLLNQIQDDAKRKVVSSLETERKALLQMATGTGKTETAKKVLDQILKKRPDARVLWLVHSNELLEQTVNRVLNLSPDLDVAVFDGETKDANGQITVASIQTISRVNNLKKFDPTTIDYIFVDEAHHSPAETWGRILKYFPNARKFGFTATPYRPDGQSLEEYFGTPVYELSFRTAQEKKLLAEDESYLILTNSVLAPSVTKEGEYSQKSLDRLFYSKDRNDIIVKSYIKYGRGSMKASDIRPKAVCYCVNAAHAQHMSQLFTAAGVVSEFIVGDINLLSAAKRKEIYTKFRNTNEIEVLCTVNIFNEAIDIPDLGCAIMARPTRSNIIYSQQLGRVARIMKGYKEKFIVLDYVDNTRREFQGYTSSNLLKKGVSHIKPIVEYLTDKDPVLVEQRVVDVTKWIENFENKFRRPNGHWGLENCIKDALMFKTRTLWARTSHKAYRTAMENKWLDACCAHMEEKRKPAGYWTYERCKEEAKKFHTKTEWEENSSGSHYAARRNKWLVECSAHMYKRNCVKNPWTLERCKEEAKHHSRRSEWGKKASGSYRVAREKGWLDICCAHMKPAWKR